MVKQEKKVRYIFSRSAPTPATSWRVSGFSVWSFGVLLLHVGIQSGIAKIRLVAKLALVISAIYVIFGATLRLPLFGTVTILTAICKNILAI